MVLSVERLKILKIDCAKIVKIGCDTAQHLKLSKSESNLAPKSSQESAP